MLEEKISKSKETSTNIAFGAGLGTLYLVGGLSTYSEIQRLSQKETSILTDDSVFTNNYDSSTPVNLAGPIVLWAALGLTYLFKKSLQMKDVVKHEN